MNENKQNKRIDFQFQYRITYADGRFYDRPHVVTARISMDEYKRIIQGVLEGKLINEIDNITKAIEKMTGMVCYIDSWVNMNGSQRTEPLKKARKIAELEFLLPDSEYKRLRKMKDPMKTFDRPEQHMTIYRDDGSSVEISYEYGQVKVVDSRKSNSRIIREVDSFLSLII